jgi:hypothetical protein
VEHVARYAVRELGLASLLTPLGFHGPPGQAALGVIGARLAGVGSEPAAHASWQETSGLAEWLGTDAERLRLPRLYEVGDRLLKHPAALEAHLFQRHLLAFEETITLFELTHPYLEGPEESNDGAARGPSPEKRSDGP